MTYNKYLHYFNKHFDGELPTVVFQKAGLLDELHKIFDYLRRYYSNDDGHHPTNIMWHYIIRYLNEHMDYVKFRLL